MTIGQLKEKIMALLRTGAPRHAVTLQDKLLNEYVSGYNRAIADVLAIVESMKKEQQK